MPKPTRSLPNTTAGRAANPRMHHASAMALAALAENWRGSVVGCAVSLIALAPLTMLASSTPTPLQWTVMGAAALSVVLRTALLFPLQARVSAKARGGSSWVNAFVLLALLEGCCWGVFFSLYPVNPAPYALLGTGLALGLIGIGIVSFSTVSGAWPAYALPIFLGQIYAGFLAPVDQHKPLAVLWACGIAMLALTYWRYSRVVVDARAQSVERDLLLAEQIALFESLTTGVVLVRNRVMVDCNPAFEEITGYARARLIGNSTRMLMLSDDAFERIAAIHSRVAQGQEYLGVEQRRHADGHLIDVEVSMRAIYPGHADAAVVVSYKDITQQLAAQRLLAEGQARLDLAFSALDAGVWEEDLRTGKHSFSPQFKRIVGLEGGAPLTEFRLEAHVHREDRDRTLWADQQQTLYGHPLSVVCRIRRLDGTFIWAQLQGVRGADARGQPVRIVRTITDVSAQKEREVQVMKAYREQKLIFDLAGEAIVFVSGANVDRCNAAFARMLGAPLERVVGSDIHEWIGLEISWERVIAAAQEAVNRGDGNGSFELTLRTGSGDALWTQLTARITDSARAQMICVFTDITERKRSEQQHAYDANHDPLTRLPNRRFLSQRISAALAHAKAHHRAVGVLLLDLDGFKAVNDTHGHAAGDSLLKQVAVRLTSVARENDTVARLGGDEFVVLATDVASAQHLRMVAEKIVRVVALPITLLNGDVTVHASVGVAAFPFCGQDGSELLAAADAAMYRAKQAGKNCYVMADPLPEQRTAYARSFAQEGNVIPLTREPNRSA